MNISKQYTLIILILILIYILDSEDSDIESRSIIFNSQSSLQNYFTTTNRSKKRLIEPFNDIKFQKLVLNFILSNNLSFNITNSNSFKELLNYLKKDLLIINRHNLKELLDSLYIESFNNFINKLNIQNENKGFFSITLNA
jgi:hypothetical protein